MLTRGRLAVLAALLASVPIALLTIVQPHSAGLTWSALLEQQVGVHTRNLVSLPVLILADGLCMPRLWRIIDHFPAADLIVNRERFEAARARAMRALDSITGLITSVVLACVATGVVALSTPVTSLPAWHQSSGSTPIYSLAGWWHVLVSLPLLFILVFGWLRRIVVWEMLLWRIAHCELRLVPAHPDGAAGLGFVGASVRAFASAALGLSALAAARSAELIVLRGTLPEAQIYFDAGYLVFLMCVFVAPLLVFTPVLIRAARRGALSYGALAQRMGNVFEQRWLADEGRGLDAEALSVPDFSATVDLYSVVSNARGVRFVPVRRRDMLSLVVALLIPFVPVVLMTVPMNTIWVHVKGLVF